MIVALSIRLALSLLLAAAPVATSAQTVTDIKIGQSLTRKAGTKIDVYRFVGGSGTTIRATLTAPGKAALILYTPAGEEMLTARSSGTVTLDAILPLWNAFFLGVVRDDATKQYTITLSGDEPDGHLALFSLGVGQEYHMPNGNFWAYKCWIKPGQKKKIVFEGSASIYELGRNGKEFTWVEVPSGTAGPFEHEVRFEGETSIRRMPVSEGFKESRAPVFADWDIMTKTYKGYLCA